LQAAILRVNLTHLEAGNRRRDEIAAQYLAALADAAAQAARDRPADAHLAPVCRAHPEARRVCRRTWRSRTSVCGVLYPMPIHRQPAYHDATLSLPQTEQACAEVLSLPLHPGLTNDDIARVVKEVKAFFG
jgi:aminotransferase EvaB